MSFFSNIGKALTKAADQVTAPVRKLAPNLPKPIRSVVRFSTLPLTTIATGGFVPLSTIRKAYGLSPNESKYTEIGLKTARGITATVATMGATSYLAGPASSAGQTLTFTQRMSTGASILRTHLGIASAADLAVAHQAAIPASAFAAGPYAVASPSAFGPAGAGSSYSSLSLGSQASSATALVNPGGVPGASSALGLGKSLELAATSPAAKSASGFWDLTASALLNTAASKAAGLSRAAVGETAARFLSSSPDQTGGLKSLDSQAGAGGAGGSAQSGDAGGGSALAGISPLMIAAAVAVGAWILLKKVKK